jgi:hypothetical protein
MMRRRSPSFSVDQAVISSIVRPQPRQSFNPGSITQIFRQGDSIGRVDRGGLLSMRVRRAAT